VEGLLVQYDLLLALIPFRLLLGKSEGLLSGFQFLLSSPFLFDHLSIEPSVLILMDDIIDLVIDVLILLDLLGVVDDLIEFEVKLR
jgi:hypothetical protein